MRSRVGIVAPLEKELSPFLVGTGFFESFKEGGFYFGSYGNCQFVSIVTGCGKIMAACMTQYLIDKNPRLSHIIHIGVSGGLSDRLEVGDLVIPNEIVEYDTETSLGTPEKHRISMKNTYIDFFREKIPEHVCGVALSGDRDVTDQETRTILREKYNALTADWESYAVAKVCEINFIPCVVVRTISDNADAESPKSYEENISRVSTNLASRVLSVEKMLYS